MSYCSKSWILDETHATNMGVAGVFKKVKNRIHFAIHGLTSEEFIEERADAEKFFIALLTFKGNHPILMETKTAKNYLNERAYTCILQRIRHSTK